MDRVGFSPRLLAAFLDLAFFLPVLIGATLFAVFVPPDPSARIRVHDAIIPLWWLLYSSMEILWVATPGKMLLRQRIAAANGEPADFWRRLLRWQTKQLPFICSLLLALTGFVPFHLLGGLMNTILLAGCLAALNDDKRAWHDEWAGTAVFRRPRRVGAPPPPLPTS